MRRWRVPRVACLTCLSLVTGSPKHATRAPGAANGIHRAPPTEDPATDLTSLPVEMALFLDQQCRRAVVIRIHPSPNTAYPSPEPGAQVRNGESPPSSGEADIATPSDAVAAATA